ncbi:MAG: hypothetical protein JNK87_27915 [Bryobacterales bacterium]|nr:hypothetical protein [Bryobacterales bacterium]
MQYAHPVKARPSESGFMLLFVFLLAAALALSMYVEMPRQAFESQRMREEMVVDRGMEYRRAIQLYVRKKKQYPPNMDALEKDGTLRFLRRRYSDPLTGKDDWRLVHIGPNGEFTDSVVNKQNQGKKEGWSNSFISEGPVMGAAPTSANATANPAVNRDQQRGIAAQGMPAPGADGQGQGQVPGQQQNYSEAGQGGYFNPQQQQLLQQQQQQQQLMQQQMQQQQQYNPNYPSQATNSQGFNPNNPQGQPVPYQQVGPMQQGQMGYPTYPSTYPTAAQPGTIPGTYPTAIGQPGVMTPNLQGTTGINPVNPYISPAGQVPGNVQRFPMYGTQVPASSQTGGVVPQQNPYANPYQQQGINPYQQQAANPYQQQAQNPYQQQGTNPYQQGGFGQPGYGQPSPMGQPGNGTMGQPNSGFGGAQGGTGQSPIINQGVGQQIMNSLTRPSAPGGIGGGMNSGLSQTMGAGIAGVASKFEGKSIMLVNERDLYQEWEFLYDARRDSAMTSSGVNLNTQATQGMQQNGMGFGSGGSALGGGGNGLGGGKMGSGGGTFNNGTSGSTGGGFGGSSGFGGGSNSGFGTKR